MAQTRAQKRKINEMDEVERSTKRCSVVLDRCDYLLNNDNYDTGIPTEQQSNDDPLNADIFHQILSIVD